MLAPDTREAMKSVAERLVVPAGDLIFSEGEQTNDLYVVSAGEALGLRAGGDEDDADWPVLRASAGDVLGEREFLDGGARDMTVRAETDCVVHRISPFDLLELENGDHFYDNLRASLGVKVAQSLRVGTEIHVATLRHQLELSRAQQHFGQFFLYVLAMFSIGMLVSNIVAQRILEIDIYTQLFAWQFLLLLLVPSFIIVWLMKIPLDQLGLTTRGMRKSLTEGTVASLLVVAASAVLVLGSRALDSVPDLPVVIGYSAIPSYFLHSFLQELVARGLFQSSFQRFLRDRRGYKSVLISGALFGIFHIHFGLLAVVLVMFSSFAFGLFYLRHQNLAGVTLLHFMAGACAFSIGLL